jgi:stage III sporulation protein SpoIIIAA
MEKRVVIIDTSNEIADSDIPHSGIGRARRMQVAKQNYNIK